VLVDQDCSDRAADTSRQRAVAQDASVECPWIANTGHGGADIPSLSGFKQYTGYLEGAALSEQAQDAALNCKTLASPIVRGEPSQTIIRQRYKPTIFASLKAYLYR
jgi:hypothetical protein